MGLLIVNIVRVMRNSDERYSWFDLEDALLQASRLAQDTGLERERTILDKVIFRGQRMMSLCHNPSQILVTWTQLLPNTRGVEQKQLLRDVKALHRVRKANGLPAAALGGGSGTRLSSAAQAQRPHVGHPKRGGYPGGSVYTPPARGPSVFAGPPVILPLHRGQGKGRSKARASQPGQSHGQAGKGHSQPLSNQELATVNRDNKRMQDMYQDHQEVPGASTCDSCRGKQRNPNHHHLLCPFTICRKCKRGGHRSNTCPY